MSSRSFFDTNVLVYAANPAFAFGDPALRLLSRGGCLSVQVLNEFVAVSRGKFKQEWAAVVAALAVFRRFTIDVVPLTAAIHHHAVEIAREHGLHIYDATIVAAALVSRCATLYSEDLQDGRIFEGRLTVRNPFAPHKA